VSALEFKVLRREIQMEELRERMGACLLLLSGWVRRSKKEKLKSPFA
jgi:hypothetical protein